MLAAFREYGRRQHAAEDETEAAPLSETQLAAQADRAIEVATKLVPSNATVLLDDPVGSGKTLVGLAAAGRLLADGTVSAVLVLAPNAKVAYAWARRAHWLGLVASIDGALLSGRAPLWKPGQIRVSTQHELQQRRSLASHGGGGLVVVDEAHRGLQHEKALIFKRLERVALGERLLLVSATPFQIQGNGLASMLGVNRPAAQRSEITRLLTNYSTALIAWLHTRRDAGGADDVDAVVEAIARLEKIEKGIGPKLKPHRLSRYRRELMCTPEPQLPGPGDPIDPGPWGLAYHIARVTLEVIGEDGEGKGDAVHRMLLSSGLAFREARGGGARLDSALDAVGQGAFADMLFERLGADPCDHPKVHATVEVATEHVNAGRHVLVFCIFKGTQRDIFDALRDRLGDDRVRKPESASALHKEDKKRFRSTDAQPLVIVARDNLSESIDLDGGLPVLIHHDLAWNPARVDQRWGRIVRASSHFRAPDVQYVPLLDLPAERRLYDTMNNRDRMGDRLLPIGVPDEANN